MPNGRNRQANMRGNSRRQNAFRGGQSRPQQRGGPDAGCPTGMVPNPNAGAPDASGRQAPACIPDPGGRGVGGRGGRGGAGSGLGYQGGIGRPRNRR